jgi:hypothetical protein
MKIKSHIKPESQHKVSVNEGGYRQPQSLALYAKVYLSFNASGRNAPRKEQYYRNIFLYKFEKKKCLFIRICVQQ